MTKQRFNSRTLFSLTTLAVCLAASTAHAGLLTGGTGSLSGSIGPRSLDIGGQAHAGLQRDTSLPSRDDKLRETTSIVNGHVAQTREAVVDKSVQVQADANASAQAGRNAAVGQADTAKALASEKLHATTNQATIQAGRAKAAATDNATQMQAGANATAQASRDTATNKAAAAQGAVRDGARKLAAVPVQAKADTHATASGASSVTGNTAHANTLATGALKLSRADRSVNASASGDASVSH